MGATPNGQLRVGHNQVENAADRLRQIMRNMEIILDDLIGDLAPLEGQWDGETQRAYRTAKKDFDDIMIAMNEVLDRTGVSLREGSEEFRRVDLKAAGYFQ